MERRSECVFIVYALVSIRAPRERGFKTLTRGAFFTGRRRAFETPCTPPCRCD